MEGVERNLGVKNRRNYAKIVVVNMSAVAATFVNRSGQNEHSLERTFHWCLLPSFSSFGWEVSEQKIKMWKVKGQQVMAKAHIAFDKVS
jgi:hypothetical protein